MSCIGKDEQNFFYICPVNCSIMLLMLPIVDMYECTKKNRLV